MIILRKDHSLILKLKLAKHALKRQPFKFSKLVILIAMNLKSAFIYFLGGVKPTAIYSSVSVSLHNVS